MPDLSHVCNLHHSSRQHWILNLLREARDQTHNHMVPSRICFHCTMMGTPLISFDILLYEVFFLYPFTLSLHIFEAVLSLVGSIWLDLSFLIIQLLCAF